MKPGDLVYASDKTMFQTVFEGYGILIRPDEGRTYVEWTNSWEIYFPGTGVTVIDGGDIEVIDAAS
jgi:hypothetical protein